jgi:predicted NAD-dependent protein-ADP-ribosyltransferase YbiA (DUF1768 family)
MLYILRHKWWQCRVFREQLKELDVCVFIEDTSNFFWGRGHGNEGLNTLGVLLHMIQAEGEIIELEGKGEV